MIDTGDILVLTNDEFRKCKCCGKHKITTEFNRKGTGYQSYCRECDSKYKKQQKLHRSLMMTKYGDFRLRELASEYPLLTKKEKGDLISILERTMDILNSEKNKRKKRI